MTCLRSGSTASVARRSSFSRIRIEGLRCRISSAPCLVGGREQDLDELLGQPLRGGRVDRPVEGDHAAERAQRIGRERALVRLQSGGTDRRAARVVVLEDHARRLVEVAHDRARRVEVEQVVERQLLAVVLLDHRQQVHPRADLLVVRRPLVRVLAVGQVGDLLVGAHEQRREVLGLLGEPARDRGVVARRVGERLRRQRLARGHRQLGVGAAQLVEHGVVGLGARHDRREREVLRRRADHRRPADVDVLDDLRGRQAAGDRALERVEVHADEVDVLDVVLAGGVDVGLVVADGEQPGVQARVQRLHAPVHHLRKAGEVLDRAHLEAGVGERRGRPARRHELDAQAGESAGEVDDAALVRDGQQRAADLHGCGCGERPRALGVWLAGDGARI